MIFRLALQSIANRRLTTSLTILSIALSVALLLGIERVRLGAKESFTGTISQTDLIVGARSGTIQLLLYTVFRIGEATANVRYESYDKIRRHPSIAWTIPYSLGDSHKGFRVVGTSDDFYKHYRYRRGQAVAWADGEAPTGMFEVALGSEVAKRLGYQVGQSIVLAHGVANISLQSHDNKPFRISGILQRTTTPIDRSLYITLEGMEALHVDWQDGAPPMPGQEVSLDQLEREPLEIGQITAFLLGTKSRFETLSLQREINTYEQEPLMAIIPGVALSQLWEGLSYAEIGLRFVSSCVVVVGLLGILIAIYTSLNERRREMSILRSLGAGARLVFSLLVAESVLLTSVGIVVGVVSLYVGMLLGQPWIESQFGFHLPIHVPSTREWVYLGIIEAFGVVIGAVPGWRAYQNSVHDGLTIRT